MAQAIVIGMRGAAAAEKEKKEKFNEQERSKILAACGLHEGDWDMVPPINKKTTENGRTSGAVRGALEQECKETKLDRDFPTSAFMSTQLVGDVKALKFAWQGSSAFESCHRGISPFAVPHSSTEVQQRLRAEEEDAEMATTTTIADVRATRTKPPPCPTDCCGMLKMTCACIKLLMILFGDGCEHLMNVTATCYLVLDRHAACESISRNNGAHLLWPIFSDARGCFNDAHDVMGNPPTSNLGWLLNAMRGGSLPSTLGAPLQALFSGSDAGDRSGGGAGGSGDRPPQRGGPAAPNPNVNSKIEAATAAARQKNSNVDCRVVMATCPLPKPQITTLQLSRGGCFDCLFFGKCNNVRCSFKQDGVIDESKIDGAIEKMRPGLAKFVELN
jgi:hypothetical protein